jgi:hypothetical protein
MTAAAITTIGSGNFLNFQSSTIVVRAINTWECLSGNVCDRTLSDADAVRLHSRTLSASRAIHRNAYARSQAQHIQDHLPHAIAGRGSGWLNRCHRFTYFLLLKSVDHLKNARRANRERY